MTTTTDIIKAAASVGRDVAEGRIHPAALDQAVADECRELFGTVVGEGDPLWELHRDVARQVLAAGGLSADELSEWLAVARSRAGEPLIAPQPEQPPIDPPASTSPGTRPHSHEIGLSEPDLSTAPEPEPQPDPEPEVKRPAPKAEPEQSLMVELPDGRRIHRRHIIARGRELPTDNGLREF